MKTDKALPQCRLIRWETALRGQGERVKHGDEWAHGGSPRGAAPSRARRKTAPWPRYLSVQEFQQLRVPLRLSALDRTAERFVVLSAVLHVAVLPQEHLSPRTQRDFNDCGYFSARLWDRTGLGPWAHTVEKYVLLGVLRDFPCRGTFARLP